MKDFMKDITAMRSADYDEYLVSLLAILANCNKKDIKKNLELYKDSDIEDLISDAVETILINLTL